jgi:pimeloyl-ACP methyl ester carboxylesterase
MRARAAVGLAVVAASALMTMTMTTTAATATAADAAVPISVLREPVQYLDVDGARLGYRVAGHGRPLVLIEGFGSTMAEWQSSMLDQLAARHRVIVFDNRGVGTSTGSVAHLSVALMARDTAQLISRLVRGPADVLGWSMGGFIAQELAISSPASVRRLVLASTDCGGPDSTQPSAHVVDILTSPTATTAQHLGILFPANRIGAGAAWFASIGEMFAANGELPADSFDISPTAARAQADAIGPRWYARGAGTCSRLARISVPTLVGAGLDDVVIPSVNHRALQRGIPRTITRLYHDAGHAFLFQPGLGFTTTVDSFLRAS